MIDLLLYHLVRRSALALINRGTMHHPRILRRMCRQIQTQILYHAAARCVGEPTAKDKSKPACTLSFVGCHGEIQACWIGEIEYNGSEGLDQGLTVFAGAVRCFIEAALHAAATELLR